MLMTDLEDLGVQRVVINLFNHFDKARIEPTLVLWKKEGKVSSFLDEQLSVIETDHDLLRPRLLFRLFRYLRIIRKLRPDVVLSFVPVTNVSYAMIKMFMPRNIGFIACEHAFITRAFSNGEYYGAFKLLYRAMFGLTYNRLADRLIMTANVGKQDAVDNWGLQQQKIQVIYNPQDIQDLCRRAAEPLEDTWFQSAGEPIIIGAGRLTKQKGFDSLLQAFALLNKSMPCRLAILGRGELEQSLKSLAIELGVAEKVRFLGFQSNHLKYIRHASVFVLSSVWEAMPMIVAETMAIGTPIVSFDCPSGPLEMLDGGKCGYLVADQDVDAMVETLMHVLKNTDEAKQKATLALLKVKQFDVKKIVDQYQHLIAEVVFKNQII